MNDVNRTEGILAALDYLGFDFGYSPFIGKAQHKFPRRKPRRLASLIVAMKMRILQPKMK